MHTFIHTHMHTPIHTHIYTYILTLTHNVSHSHISHTNIISWGPSIHGADHLYHRAPTRCSEYYPLDGACSRSSGTCAQTSSTIVHVEVISTCV